MFFGLAFLVSYKRLKLGAFKESLLCKTNRRKIHVFKINTFANAFMFILRELKDISFVEKLLKTIAFMNSIGIIKLHSV